MTDSGGVLRDFRAIAEEVTQPDPQGTAEAFAQTGYRFELAVADLVDNSIDAHAEHVLVRFVTEQDRIARIVIADDGIGMTKERLRQAMQYGARPVRGPKDLGRYGVGMKSASLSQCRRLSVVTRANGAASGRRWTEEAIRSGWKCEILDSEEIAPYLDAAWGPVSTLSHGTLVIWDGLDRLRGTRQGLERLIDGLFRVLNVHLGLVFHRYIESGALAIAVDRVDSSSDQGGLPLTIDSLNPFSYPVSGAAGWPRAYEVPMRDGISISLTAHVWPPKSKLPGYRLGGGRVAGRQGFYFYRNDRLIQAGGWNGWRDSETEPHLSLARCSVELSPATDRLFGLSLHKSAIDAPAMFLTGLDVARSPDGTSFRQYVVDATDAYRSASSEPADKLAIPVVGRGLRRPLRARVRAAVAGKDPNVRRYQFVWATLPASTVVDIDRDADTIRLNRSYREHLMADAGDSPDNGELVKVLIFAALRPLLGRERTSAPLRRELETVNQLLFAALESRNGGA